MMYVYILKSEKYSSKTYIGITNNLKRRLQDHNSGQAEYTHPYKPWSLVTYIAFSNEVKAREFEKYLKKSGGWRFAKRRLV